MKFSQHGTSISKPDIPEGWLMCQHLFPIFINILFLIESGFYLYGVFRLLLGFLLVIVLKLTLERWRVLVFFFLLYIFSISFSASVLRFKNEKSYFSLGFRIKLKCGKPGRLQTIDR